LREADNAYRLEEQNKFALQQMRTKKKSSKSIQNINHAVDKPQSKRISEASIRLQENDSFSMLLPESGSARIIYIYNIIDDEVRLRITQKQNHKIHLQ